MKRISALALGLLFSVGLAPHSDAASQFGRERTNGRDRVCVYQDIQFHGWEQCYNAGDEVNNLGNHGKAISSLRIYGRARVTVYEDTGMRGNSTEFTSDVPDLGLRSVGGSHTWNDRIQSLRVSTDSNEGSSRNAPPVLGRDTNRNPDQPINEGVCVYDRPDFQGREQCWGEDVGDLGRSGGWSDRISSIRVFGGARVMAFRDIQYRGASIAIDRDIPNLSQLSGQGFRNWDRQISSIRVETRGYSGRDRTRSRNRF